MSQLPPPPPSSEPPSEPPSAPPSSFGTPPPQHPVSGAPLNADEPWMSAPERSGGGKGPMLVVGVVAVLAIAALVVAVLFATGALGGDDDGVASVDPPPTLLDGITIPEMPDLDELMGNIPPGITIPDLDELMGNIPPGITIPDLDSLIGDALTGLTIPDINELIGDALTGLTIPDITIDFTIPSPGGTTGGDVDLFSGTQASDAIADVAAEVGAGPIRILRAVVYPTYAFVQVQDPSIPEYVDEYQWRGTVREPTPVRLMGTVDLAEALYSANEADWTVIPALTAAAPGLTGIPDGEVTHVIVERPLPFSSDVRMRVFVVGSRASGYVDADATGSVIDVWSG